jgi:hypothetical protein
MYAASIAAARLELDLTLFSLSVACAAAVVSMFCVSGMAVAFGFV